MQGSNTVRAGAETRAKRHYGGGVLRLVPPRRPEGTSEAGERKERAIDLAVASQWLACTADRLQAQLLRESRWSRWRSELGVRRECTRVPASRR